MRQLMLNEGGGHITSSTIDDLALLTFNNENRKEVDTVFNAFDDLQLIRKKTTKHELRNDLMIDRMSLRPHDSLYKAFNSERIDEEEVKEPKFKKRTTHSRISEFLAPAALDSRPDDAKFNYRSTSLSLKSIKKKKAQELTTLYEFDQDDDPDPFFEIYDWQRMTFMESLLNKHMNSYTRVELKHNTNKIRQTDDKENIEEDKPKTFKIHSIDHEKMLRPIYFDQEEHKLYVSYFTTGGSLIDKRAEYSKRVIQPECDVASLTSTFYDFIQPLYKESDYKIIDENEKLKKDDLKSDSEIIKKYINFDSVSNISYPNKERTNLAVTSSVAAPLITSP